MYALFKKEISNFLSSLIGIMVIVIFLLITGLFLWVFQSDFNIMSFGYANLDSLFILAPWVFLFLVPAITMRSFAEERRTGTIEMLFTKPLSDWQIVLGKYLAGVTLVLLALIPTFIYFFSVYNLSQPVGNVDIGGIWGSYIGLFERIIIVIFIYLQAYSAIGFVITAKSVARYDNIAKDQQFAEYTANEWDYYSLE